MVLSVQSSMCGPPCFVYCHVVFIFFLFIYFFVFFSFFFGPECLTVNNGQYFTLLRYVNILLVSNLCRVHIKALTRIYKHQSFCSKTVKRDERDKCSYMK